MDIILKYFPNLSLQQRERFYELNKLYKYWNQKINVISRKDIDNLYEHHVLHSLSIAKFFNFPEDIKILDVGTGGGFPGIPLSIFFENSYFVLVDSIGKKINVVKNIISELGLSNATAIHSRIEDIKEKFPIIVSRSVTSLPEFYKMVKKNIYIDPKIPVNGIIYLKGGDFSDEINELKKVTFSIYNISEVFEEEFFLTKKIIYLIPDNK